MATALTLNTYPHIVKTPGVRGGKARIDGTRICVRDIVALRDRGLSPEAMLDYFDSRPLTLAEVHAALAYYHDHRDEIDGEFAAADEAEASHERRRAEHLARQAVR
jgi:uncharacterized protein (DUF433 family)